MAEDKDSKTEQPTSKKLNDARKKGNVGKSAEVVGAIILFFGSIYLIFYSSELFVQIKKMMLFVFSFVGKDMEDATYYAIGNTVLNVFLIGLAPLFMLVVFLAIASNVMQFGFLMVPLKIDFSKLNPINGLKNLFSLKKLVEALKLTAKLIVIFTVMYSIVLVTANDILSMLDMGLGDSIEQIVDLLTYYVTAILIIIIIFAIIDMWFVKHHYIKSLKMTKQEVKEEHKQMDGNPEIKGRIRRIQMKMAMQRMMSNVQDADVVITNPTHYAVALQYEQGGVASAPLVVAKGTDFIALKIKDIANEHNIPIIENPSIAKALHAQIEIDEEIPEEFYQAIADIFSYIYQLKNKKLR
jgi:flagellar biosynthetic protein FlhB